MKKDLTVLVENTKTMKEIRESRDSTIWKGSRFQHLKEIPSPRSKGAKAEQITQEIMEALGHKVKKPKSKQHDRIIDGYKTEIKFSTSWSEKYNLFTWQQIRGFQDYQRIIFVGCNPNDIQFWWATKEDLKKHVFGKDKLRQHGGKDGDQELYWLKDVHKRSWFRDLSTF